MFINYTLSCVDNVMHAHMSNLLRIIMLHEISIQRYIECSLHINNDLTHICLILFQLKCISPSVRFADVVLFFTVKHIIQICKMYMTKFFTVHKNCYTLSQQKLGMYRDVGAFDSVDRSGLRSPGFECGLSLSR